MQIVIDSLLLRHRNGTLRRYTVPSEGDLVEVRVYGSEILRIVVMRIFHLTPPWGAYRVRTLAAAWSG